MWLKPQVLVCNLVNFLKHRQTETASVIDGHYLSRFDKCERKRKYQTDHQKSTANRLPRAFGPKGKYCKLSTGAETQNFTHLGKNVLFITYLIRVVRVPISVYFHGCALAVHKFSGVTISSSDFAIVDHLSRLWSLDTVCFKKTTF